MKRPVLTQTIASLAEANDILARIGEHQREIETMKSELEASIATVREVANKEIAPLEKEVERLTKSLEIFANQHRSTLLVGEKKSVVLPGGEFGWRLPPTSVKFTAKGGEATVLQTLLAMEPPLYVRHTPSVDREALLRDRPTVSGVKYSQKEGFYVKPESGKEPDTFPGTVVALTA